MEKEQKDKERRYDTGLPGERTVKMDATRRQPSTRCHMERKCALYASPIFERGRFPGLGSEFSNFSSFPGLRAVWPKVNL